MLHKIFTKANVILVLILLSLARLICRSEIDKGICLDDDGNGQIYTDSKYNYISYKYTDATTGDELITYDLLNPFNNYCDDIVIRIDYNTTTKHISFK